MTIDPNNSIDLEAVQNYIDGDEFREVVSRPEFETRCAELFRCLTPARS